MFWAVLLIAAIALWPESMVWGLSRLGYLALIFFGLVLAAVVFWG
jgi:hypothetical protein